MFTPRWQQGRRNQLEAAQQLYLESTEVAQQHHHDLLRFANFWGQGWVAYRRGEYAQAVSFYQQALRYFVQVYALDWVVKTLGALALTQSALGKHHSAVRFFACARALQDSTHQQKILDPDMQQIAAAQTALRAQLPPLTFDLHWQRGWHWTLEHVLAAALDLG
ncbi:MAG: hypothetical protein OHK0052_05380 [Anaerolineales bacterium]